MRRRKVLLGLLLVILIIALIFYPPSFLKIKPVSVQVPEKAAPVIPKKTILPNVYNNSVDITNYAQIPAQTDESLKEMLMKEAGTLHTAVINKVIQTIQCAKEYNVTHNDILAIIDYSLPSSDKRLWIFNLKDHKLLFHTYVSHGIKSGTLDSQFFSNKFDSKASSIGVYKTEKTYYGRDGLSLRLCGLDRGFNDNASNRYVVMHGGWYVEEDFIKKYGRAGRSWGCPAVPLQETQAIINTIKDDAFFVVYYPSDNWFLKSKFLNCSTLSSAQNTKTSRHLSKENVAVNETRDEILFVDLNKNGKHDDHEPVVAMTADRYREIFNTKVPLGRMLRRQINHTEYVALSSTEFKNLPAKNLREVAFIIPNIRMSRGYYLTEMHIAPYGTIKAVTGNNTSNYTVHFEEKPLLITLKPSNKFIRWLGL